MMADVMFECPRNARNPPATPVGTAVRASGAACGTHQAHGVFSRRGGGIGSARWLIDLVMGIAFVTGSILMPPPSPGGPTPPDKSSPSLRFSQKSCHSLSTVWARRREDRYLLRANMTDSPPLIRRHHVGGSSLGHSSFLLMVTDTISFL